MRRPVAVASGAAIVVAVALLLASLSPAPPQRTTAAFEPPPVEFADGPDARPGAWSGPSMALRVLAASDLSLGALSSEAVLPVTVPEDAVQVLVNMTFLTGATKGFGFTGLSTCQSWYDFPIVGDGVMYAVDCGGALPGAHDVRFGQAAGEVRVRVEVVAWVCLHGPCADIPPRQ